MSKGLMSTDQQVIFSIYADKSLNFSEGLIPLQLYSMYGSQKYNSDPWFYLGYAMRKEGNYSEY